MDTHHGHYPLLQDLSEWILGKPVPAMLTVINKKDFALRTTHICSSQPELADQPFPVLVEPSMQVGMKVLGRGKMPNFS